MTNVADDEFFTLTADQALVHVEILDQNDNAPVFSIFGKDNVNTISIGISSYTSSGQDVLQLSVSHKYLLYTI